ncbi:AbrB/MazE/SpoVT family DNA-binding domain-containing protein [Candidatus Woesearchaeota archaeon]|nr:AbrB/MazE/SpoVT family DNA-binding domain-containing protein [Candidatus Woesearchaeota archaeon]
MKRKVIQIADSTQLVSLPRKWALRNNVRKGDELEVNEQGAELVVSCKSDPKTERAEIDLNEYGKFSHRLIFSLYKKGVDEIKVNLRDPSDVKKVQAILQNETVGYEIIENTKNYCLVKNVSGYIEGFDSMLRRVFLLMISMAEEGFRAMKERKPEDLANAAILERSNNRFTTVCRRYLNKGGESKYAKLGPLYYIVEDLENMADEFKYLFKALSKLKKEELKFSKEALDYYERLLPMLRSFYDCFYKEDPAKVVEVREFRQKMIDDWYDLLPKSKSAANTLLLHHTVVLVQKIFNLLGPAMVLQVKVE